MGTILLVNAASLNILDRLEVSTDRASSLEVTTLLLRTKRSGNSNTHGNDSGSNTHDGAVGGRALAAVGGDHHCLGSSVNNLGRGRGNHVSKLIGKTNKGGTESRGRQLVKVDGNDTPGTLDEELDHEAGSRETALGGGEDPGGNEESRHESSADNGATTTEPLRDVTEDSTTNTGTSLHEDGSASGTGGAEVLLLLHEGGVGVLAGVGVEVEPSHEEDAVDDHAPLSLQHDLGLGPESTRSLVLLLAQLLCLDELLGLGEANTDKTNEDGEASTDPEDNLPGVGLTTDTKVGASSENITERVTLLENTRHQTTCVDTKVVSMGNAHDMIGATYGQFSRAMAMALP